MFSLPTRPTVAEVKSPRKLVIYSHPKVGKTTAVSYLKNALILDFEEGAGYVDGMSLNIPKILRDNPKENILTVLTNLKTQLDDYYAKNGKWQYDYIVVDTTTSLEDYARPYATVLYKQTPMGKVYTGTNVINDLPQGGGYGYLREAFEKLLALVDKKCNVCTILIAHSKDATINKMGKDLQAKDIQLTGKLKMIVCADADGIGFMYRNPTNLNQTLLSFVSHEQDLATGARQEHIAGREFVILELQNPDFVKTGEKRVFTNEWDKIFI